MLTIVTGPPCVGKTTYVRQHAEPGDIIIDLDDLITALGGNSHDPSPAVLRVAQAARVTAIRSATICHRDGAPVWVIDTSPPAWLRARYRASGGQIIELTDTAGVLHQRAADAGRPARIHKVIDDCLAGRRTGDAAAAGGRIW
jgi:hypothetical protein